MENKPSNHPTLSIVVPCYNEEGSLSELYAELSHTLELICLEAEIIFVDDGSKDQTLTIIRQFAEKDCRVRVISFSRNFGHQKALRAGIDRAMGAAIVMMDADLQHPPNLIPELVARWQSGFDVVNTIRRDESGISLFKRFSSKGFYKLMNVLSDLEFKPGRADFRLIDRQVVEVLKRCPEEFLFLRGMVSWCGFKQTELIYQANSRFSGKSKYTFTRMNSFAFCGITSFSIRPLRLSVIFSAIFVLLSLLEITYVIHTVISGESVPGWASLAVLISILGAAILLILGIIGEYLGKLFIESKNRPAYIVKMER